MLPGVNWFLVPGSVWCQGEVSGVWRWMSGVIWVSGIRCQVSSVRYSVSGVGCQALGVRCLNYQLWCQMLGARCWSVMLGVMDVRCWVPSVGCQVLGVGCQVLVSDFGC